MGWFGLSGKEHNKRDNETRDKLRQEAKSWKEMADNETDPRKKLEYERAARGQEEEVDEDGWDGRW